MTEAAKATTISSFNPTGDAPLISPEVDLRDFAFIPVEVRRLLTSETWLAANGDEKAAAVTLWLESWHQVPAGSLPDNDRMLAVLSQAGGKWRRVKEAALRGWVKCSDGRLYHPVVCEKAISAWGHKQAQRKRTEAARQTRLNKRVTASVTERAAQNVTGSNREGEGEGQTFPSQEEEFVGEVGRCDGGGWNDEEGF